MATQSERGCTSREHAQGRSTPRDYGFRPLVAPSFGEIFCLKNDLLPIVHAEPIADKLFAAVEGVPGYRLTIDLPAQEVRTPSSEGFNH